MRDKKSFGSKLVDGLKDFAEAIESENFQKLTIRTVSLDLEPEAYDGERVKQTRKLLKVSQAVFAQLLGVSVSTVQSWEQGDNKPQDIACRFMDEIRLNPDYFAKRIQDSVKKKPVGA